MNAVRAKIAKQGGNPEEANIISSSAILRSRETIFRSKFTGRKVGAFSDYHKTALAVPVQYYTIICYQTKTCSGTSSFPLDVVFLGGG